MILPEMTIYLTDSFLGNYLITIVGVDAQAIYYKKWTLNKHVVGIGLKVETLLTSASHVQAH